MKVVFDSNVLISAFLWQRGLKSIYQMIRSGKVIPCFNQATWAEFLRVLSYKKFEKQLSKIDISPEQIIKLLASRSHFVISRLEITEIKQDPTDNDFLACAVSSGAYFIVSSDKHLLRLKSFQGILILSPKQFLSRF